MRASLKGDLLAYARSLGFDRMGVASVDPLTKAESILQSWLAEGKAGSMSYMERDPSHRARPADHLAQAQSVIALAMNYYPGERPTSSTSEGLVSRYARGVDYHKVLQKRLDSFVRYLETLAPGAECRTYVDTGPLLERSVAQRAGLGFIGKNTMLITRGLGSWVFLANVITTLQLPADAPDERSCGTCRLCIDACPTDALSETYQLDARRCISYLTIELEGAVEPALRSRMGGWIFGCDICQEVCPHNARPQRTSQASFATGTPMPTLSELLSLSTDEAFLQRFKGTPLVRAERHGLIRNACLAAAHFRRTDLIPQLEKLSRDDAHPVVREQAAWTLEALHQATL